MFILPTFNLTANVWTSTFIPPIVPPRLTTSCNLALGRRTGIASTGGTGVVGTPLFAMWLLLPKLTDIRGPLDAGGKDVVEVPAGSGRFYTVEWMDDAGKGFANEHRFAMIEPAGVWPTPVP